MLCWPAHQPIRSHFTHKNSAQHTRGKYGIKCYYLSFKTTLEMSLRPLHWSPLMARININVHFIFNCKIDEFKRKKKIILLSCSLFTNIYFITCYLSTQCSLTYFVLEPSLSFRKYYSSVRDRQMG